MVLGLHGRTAKWTALSQTQSLSDCYVHNTNRLGRDSRVSHVNYMINGCLNLKRTPQPAVNPTGLASSGESRRTDGH